MLTPGTSLGPYRILASIGAGGMGEVYRAHDTRLGRDVAVKVLSPRLAATPEARARFEREARTISQLNHPHICALHDVGHQDGTDYLVMELLEGETLAHRLEKGPLPLAAVLTLGTQIADALDRAHRAGVVHRDLKPGNVMLTKDGAKLMDFGLAHASPGAGESAALTESPTTSRSLTADGAIVGTFQYMAPEQLEGKETDAPTDLWALGCVLYEMATGRPAFSGTSQASLIAAILKEEPKPITELQPAAPSGLDAIVRRCLQKEPAARFQSAGDVAFSLQALTSTPPSGVRIAAATAAWRPSTFIRWRILAWLVGGAALVALGMAGGRYLRSSTDREGATFLDLVQPRGIKVSYGSVSFSRDGRRLVFVGRDARETALWLRALDSPVSRKLPGTGEAMPGQRPIWSPDGRYILFAAEGHLKRVELASGTVETLWTRSSGGQSPIFSGDWNEEGEILFSWVDLYRLPASGGEPERIAAADPRDLYLAAGQWLPDGRHYLLFAAEDQTTERGRMFVGRAGSAERIPILSCDSPAALTASGHLLFERSGSLFAQRFDEARLRLRSEPRRLVDGIYPSASKTAVVFKRAGYRGRGQLCWFGRDGREEGHVGDQRTILTFDLSPDGARIAAAIGPLLGTRLALIDAARGSAPIDWLTDSPDDADARFSPDGKEIIFTGRRDSGQGLFRMSLRDRQVRPVLAQSIEELERRMDRRIVAHDWSRDGRWMLYSAGDEALAAVALTDPSHPVLIDSAGTPDQARFSPDGRWIAYNASEVGASVRASQVYLLPFPPHGERIAITRQGGVQPLWRADGRELYYLDLRGNLMAVDIRTEPDLVVGPPRLLFYAGLETVNPSEEDYAVTADGQRFLVKVPPEGEVQSGFTVLQNWPALLRGR